MCDCHMGVGVHHLQDIKILAQKKDAFVKKCGTLVDFSVIWFIFNLKYFSEDNFLSQFRYWNIFICVNAIRVQCLPIIYELPFPLPLPRVQFVSAIVASLHWCGFHITAWESRGYKKIVVSSKFVVGYSNPFTAFVCNVVVNQGTALRK